MHPALHFLPGLALVFGQDPSPEFVTLSNAWKGALSEFGVARLRYDRENGGLPQEKRDPAGPPRHPAAAFWKRFERLGAGGDPDALEWQVEQSENAFNEGAQRADSAEKALRELLRTHPEHRGVEEAIAALPPLLPSFGRERFLALLGAAHAEARGSESQARALALEAWVRADRPEEVQQLQDEILLVHPGTRAAREVASAVFARLERQFVQAELDWIAAVRTLQQHGRQPADWPRQPMHAWREKYLPAAAAGGLEAREFVEQVFPRYQQAEGSGLGVGLVWLQRWWMQYAPPGAADWLRARLGLIEIVARQFRGQPLVTSALADLSLYAGPLPALELEAALAPALADDAAPAARALAHFTRAAARCEQNQSSDWQAARAELELLLREFPTEEIAARAQEVLTGMRNVWPGSRAPDFRGTDQDGQPLKLSDLAGSVCVIDFASETLDFAAPEIARRRELIQSFAGRPLRWIGGLVDSGDARSFRESLGAAGVNWRCALLGSRESEIARLWSIRVVPALFVVDAEGVIRARNLPWAEQRALLEKLVAEAEQQKQPR